MSFMVLSQREVQQCIDMKQAITVMEEAFKESYLRQTILPLRTPVAVEKENALMLTMPAYLSQKNALGLKVISVFPNNTAKKKPAINGVMLLLNEETGEAQAIMEAGYLTAMRTGAVSGLATKYLAKENANEVAIIGSGVQAVTQLEAVASVRPIRNVSIWSRSFENSKRFAQKIEDKYEVECHQTIREAVKNADVICTATASTEPLICLADLKPDVHINAVGSHTRKMREINNDVMAKAVIVVDQLEAALSEAGEVISALEERCIRQEDIKELGAIVNANQTPNQKRITLFKSVGLAIQDISIAHAVYMNALKQGLGTSLSLM
ncbi:ornithine cyclodeaminase family protein [Legionella maioricensis]|uniref:Delta(1)-pyrroline-2-carboxylate reductase n=1 Tax=Legionella maioricensis TaxID=2896528 RepID=A0A9X2D0X2_9GAMM|nr:ornithine cyclodeaminase family protein [Legionella maioricensis]MCL9684401.1 ornithine cyclodeaminase family protein [Legionella maioricensis]MCL9687582.1 ornithine cyclodeaminase family protein [Legionella maioricensis]